ncbi:MAG: dihydrolipoyl dehydrogenase [Deltaproteobacteria bacterium]|nr:dihydrolipoyl dehydrogenase [Deltaproteobacteria bacterium]
MTQQFDTIVVGGGPGGYAAAIRAAQLGMSVALVEREHLGGICLNWGCIPTKSLLHTADLLREMRRASDYGIVTGEIGFDAAKVVKRSRAVADQLSRGVKGLLRKNKVTVLDGEAKLAGAGRLVVTGKDGAAQELRSDAIVLATGARAKALPGIEADGELVWTYREAMVPREMPKRLLVIGSGAIGIEFASFYRALGSDVTVVEVLPRILPVEDEEISAFARKAFEKEGIAIHTNAKVESLARASGALVAKLAAEQGALEASFDRAILSVGVTGNVESLGLETTRAKAERGFVVTGAHFETAEPGIFAIGDVAGPPCLAHKASHEGVLVMEHIAGHATHAIRRERIPTCTYAHPQVASVGLTESAAAATGRKLRVGKFPLVGNGKAIAIGDSNGLVKTIFDATTGELLGAHLAGPGVTELIQGFTIAMGLETTEQQLIETIFPHPTISESMHESVLASLGRALHV